MSKPSKQQNADSSKVGLLAKIPLKQGLMILGGIVCVGAIFMFAQGSSSETEPEDISDDDAMLTGFQAKPLGALGVSDSASEGNSESGAPLEFPAAESGVLNETMPAPGPLFGNSMPALVPTGSRPEPITVAGFERQLMQPGSPTGATERPVPGTPRAVANQPVWLTGTIETTPAK